MGRGRAKAKQTKVARALKYGGPQTDFDRLQAELAGAEATHAYAAEVDEDEDDDWDDDDDDLDDDEDDEEAGDDDNY